MRRAGVFSFFFFFLPRCWFLSGHTLKVISGGWAWYTLNFSCVWPEDLPQTTCLIHVLSKHRVASCQLEKKNQFPRIFLNYQHTWYKGWNHSEEQPALIYMYAAPVAYISGDGGQPLAGGERPLQTVD